MSEESKSKEAPSVLKWALKFASAAGLSAMLCCVAPAVLFMFGIVGGSYAISFADFFYQEDGSAGVGAWALRIFALGLGIYGVYSYRKRQNQCSVDPKRKQLNLFLLTALIVLGGVGVYFMLEKWSASYFDEHIVPAQQEELGIYDAQEEE